MYNNKRILALIPARGGSKGLPYKNIKPLLGKSLIAWTIKQARKSKYIDRIIVSTEDKKIAEISKRCGAEIPFLRPKELATDKSKFINVVLHAIEWLENNNEFYDLILALQPTSPLRRTEDVDKAIRLLSFKKAKAIISVCEAKHHFYWANTLPKDGCMKNFLKEETLNKNRQELPVFYKLNGAIYLSYCDYLKKQKSFFTDRTFAYVMPREHSVDIDDYFDFELAELLMRKLHRVRS